MSLTSRKMTLNVAISPILFLEIHGKILLILARHPDRRVRDLAVDTGITERAVLRIVHDLQHAGYISIEKRGRRNHYAINAGLPMRHQCEAGVPVSVLLLLAEALDAQRQAG